MTFLLWLCKHYTKLEFHFIAVFIACSYLGVITPEKRGFFCNDQTIKYAYQGDTISLRCLFFVTMGVPIFFFTLVETWWHNVTSNCSPAKEAGFRLCFRRLGRTILDYTLGILFTTFFAETLKVIVSELRPHFLDTCRPNISSNCTDGFISQYECQSPFSKRVILDSFKSFPSGHAAISFYSAIFIILYIQFRIKDSLSRLFCPWLQALSLTWACYCSFTRITDYRHHWWDVVVGIIIGILIGTVTVLVFCRMFGDPPSANSAPAVEERIVNDTVSSQLLLSTSSEHKDVSLATIKERESNHI